MKFFSITKLVLPFTIVLLGLCQMTYGQENFEPLIKTIKKIPYIVKKDSITIPRIPIKYTFFSFPFSSDFKPKKGDAIPLKNTPPTDNSSYNSSISLGYGSYSSPLIRIYGDVKLLNNHHIGVVLKHHSSQNSITTILNNYFYNSSIVLTDHLPFKKYTLKNKLLFSQKIFNWYGLPKDVNLSTKQIESINEEQTLHKIQMSSILIQKKENPIKKMMALVCLSLDAFDSKEIEISLNMDAELEVDQQNVFIESNLHYTYSQLNLGEKPSSKNVMISIMPYTSIIKEHILVKAGVAMYFNSQNTNLSQSFNIYPTLYSSYKLLNNYIITYGGVSGGQTQNTYSNFLEKNQFISPRVELLSTKEDIKIFFGTKGKIHPNINYDIYGFVLFESQKPLFKLNSINPSKWSFDYGNSFDVVYDDMTTLKSSINLSWVIGDQGNLNWVLSLASYNPKNQKKAWNIPSFESHIFGQYHINKNFLVKTNIFYKGSRYDILTDLRVTPKKEKIIKSSGYIDANIHLEYYLFDNFSSFLNINNIFGNNYYSITNYQVQERQLNLGITYKF